MKWMMEEVIIASNTNSRLCLHSNMWFYKEIIYLLALFIQIKFKCLYKSQFLCDNIFLFSSEGWDNTWTVTKQDNSGNIFQSTKRSWSLQLITDKHWVLITVNNQIETQNQGSLFRPLLYVSHFSISRASLALKTNGLLLLTFSKISLFISLRERPGRLKWPPQGSETFSAFL